MAKIFIGKENEVGKCVINEHLIFVTEEEAQQVAKAVKECLGKFQKRIVKNEQ